jgi:plastocyanin
MHAAKLLVATVCVFAANPSALQAATHEVQVIDFSVYVPDDISITVGDTVRWTNGAGGNPHDVTADDHSWASPVGIAFVYEHAFNTVGEIGYHCAYHDPNDEDGTHRGIIRVQADDEPGLTINPGLSDAWYDPQTGGQGFFIIVWEDIETIFLSWFTYDTERPPANVAAHLGDPGHRWLTAQGPYSGDTATLTVYETAGGVFDSAQPAPGPSAEIGTITITWAGCNAGELSYDLPGHGLAGTIPIERIVLDNVPLCETLGAP